ncbi:MAG TPA: SDR family NAD(P)-dependent oxidoreductase [Egibacteraceae bacterium]|nr:SDR family NAD(P)-dependent oxidoreductase [Egibacteraceae bacterium]
MAESLRGKVALVTGGAGGFGAAMGRRLAARGAQVVLADVHEEGAAAVAEEIGGAAVRCDVSSLEDNLAAVAFAVERFGGLDIVALNAGVSTGFGIEDDFDVDKYRRVMGINLDGVVFGLHAALPRLRGRGGGDVIATASLAGLTPVPMDPLYAANKAAVVHLVRSLGPVLGDSGIRVNALCPSFAHTPIITPIREALEGMRTPILPVDAVMDAFERILDSGQSGQAWFVQYGRPSEPFGFRGVPGPRVEQ